MTGKAKVGKSRAITVPSKAKVAAPRFHRYLGSLIALMLLGAGIGLVVGSIRLALKLLVDPNAIAWLDPWLPARSHPFGQHPSTPKTLADIKDSIHQEGFIPGEEILLEPSGDQKAEDKKTEAPPPDLLLPVQTESTGCLEGSGTSDDGSCLTIVELRVYQPVSTAPTSKSDQRKKTQDKSIRYWLVSQLAIDGPEESTAIAALVTAQSDNQGSKSILPLTQLAPFPGEVPKSGIWFNLQGRWRYNNQLVHYGQVIHYNPDRTYLSSLLTWTSPQGEPVWQNLTGEATPALMVDQSVGMEPDFRVYRLRPRRFLPNPIQLEQITLAQPGVNNSTYRNILYLARTGLWSPALSWMQSVKSKTASKNWSGELQAQLDLIQLHAKATQAQAEQTWASPAQQLAAYLIDGRWSKATEFLSKNNQNLDEIIDLLKNDGDRLWDRVEVALKINPKRLDVQMWGALILTARQSRAAATAWLKKQPGYKKNAQLEQLMASLEAATLGVNPNSGESAEGSHPSRIIGAGRAVDGVNLSEWLVPKEQAKPTLNAGERWYEIEVNEFQDGKRWRRSPFTNLPVTPGTIDKIWPLLGLNNDSYVQLTLSTTPGQQQTITVFVQAVRNQGGRLQLLATGEAATQGDAANAKGAPPALALSMDAATWLDGEITNLPTIQQDNPQQTTIVVNQLWRELQRSGYLAAGPVPPLDQALGQTEVGAWEVQRIDLTGNDAPEIVLRVDAQSLANLAASQASTRSVNFSGSRTLIFSDAGTLIYSELSLEANQLMAGIVSLPDRAVPALLVYVDRTYTVQQWSAANTRFQ